MKTIFLLLFGVLCSLVIFTSCGTDTVTYIDNAPIMREYEYVISDVDWSFSPDNTYASIEISVPGITENVFLHGLVLVQIQGAYNGMGSYPNEWYSIPYTSVANPDNGYQQVYGMSYNIGRVTLDLEAFNTFVPTYKYLIENQPTNYIKVIVFEN